MENALFNEQIFQNVFFGNTVEKYSIALSLGLIVFISLRIFRRKGITYFEKFAKKTANAFDDIICTILKDIPHFFFLFFSFYFAVKILYIPEKIEKIIDGTFLILFIYETVKAIRSLLLYALEKIFTEKSKTALHGIKLLSTITLWTIGILLILSNLGLNISALATSLGIGGIAVALALQNILSDLFSSFSIYFDKPFQIGDYIVIGNDGGIVQKIGLKTTRIQTLHGEELVMSNQELTSARVKNFKKMKSRRISFVLGVEYSTPTEKLKKIPNMIQKIITKEKNTEFLRCHFTEFGDFSLKIETTYYVHTGDYQEYMDIQQDIYLDIKSHFEKENITMAFPTQTLFLQKEEK
jgi:small-conductance mechanosensitive channel